MRDVDQTLEYGSTYLVIHFRPSQSAQEVHPSYAFVPRMSWTLCGEQLHPAELPHRHESLSTPRHESLSTPRHYCRPTPRHVRRQLELLLPCSRPDRYRFLRAFDSTRPPSQRFVRCVLPPMLTDIHSPFVRDLPPLEQGKFSTVAEPSSGDVSIVERLF